MTEATIYNNMIEAAKEQGFEVHYNVPVEGTDIKLIAWVKEFNTAFVDITPFNPTLHEKEVYDAKMRVVKEKTGIRNLLVYVLSFD